VSLEINEKFQLTFPTWKSVSASVLALLSQNLEWTFVSIEFWIRVLFWD